MKLGLLVTRADQLFGPAFAEKLHFAYVRKIESAPPVPNDEELKAEVFPSRRRKP